MGVSPTRQLCKRLVAARGRPVTREELADQLWPDEADASKLGPRLSVQLSAVRRVLGGGVVADRRVVALDLDEVTTDLETLMTSEEHREILATYSGDFLPGDIDEPWSAGARDGARSRYTASAHQLLANAGPDNDGLELDEAETIARKLIELDRWDEAAHRALIRGLHARGLEGDARRSYEVYVAAMKELDVDVDEFEALLDRT